MNVVLTAPRPTSRIPSFPLADAISTGWFTIGRSYHVAMFFRFKRMRPMDPLQVAMTGVRMGERFLQIGCDDKTLLAGLGAKVGLSGSAALAAADEATAERGRAAAAKAGVLLDVRTGPVATWSFDAGAFDMVVVDDTAGRFAATSEDERRQALAVAWNALRAGGRIEVVERTA